MTILYTLQNFWLRTAYSHLPKKHNKMKHHFILLFFLLSMSTYLVAQEARTPRQRPTSDSSGAAVKRNPRANTTVNSRPKKNLVEKYRHKTTAAELNLIGKVKSIKEDTHSEKITLNGTKKIEEDESKYYMNHQLRVFDEAGNEIKTTTFNKDGSINSSWESKYSKPGMVSEINDFNGKHEPDGKEVFEYDANDYLIANYKYDKAGRPKGQPVKRKYRFNTDDYMVDTYVMQYVKPDGTAEPDEMIYTYSGYDSTLSSVESLSPYSSFTYRRLYSYDEKKRHVKTVFAKSLAKEGEDTRKAGFYTSVTTTFQYDEHNNIFREIREYSKESLAQGIEVVNYVYTYDSKGNWIKKVSKKEGNTEYQVTVREITYY
jgi:hypothetical protein